MPTARLSSAQARCDPVPGARGAVLHLALIGFRVSDEIRQIAARDTAAGDQNERLDRHQGHRREVGCGIVERLLVDQRALRVGRLAAEQECVAVGVRPRDARGAGHAAGTGHVFDDHRLMQDLGQPRRIDSPKRVVDPARSERHHHGHRPRRPILRTRLRAQRNKQCDKNQQPTTRHYVAPRLRSSILVGHDLFGKPVSTDNGFSRSCPSAARTGARYR